MFSTVCPKQVYSKVTSKVMSIFQIHHRTASLHHPDPFGFQALAAATDRCQEKLQIAGQAELTGPWMTLDGVSDHEPLILADPLITH